MLHLLLPGDPATLTGGYLYDARIVTGLRRLGWGVVVHPLDGGFPHPNAAALGQAAGVFERLPDGAKVVIDGLALGGMPELVAAQAERLRLIALIHHPLALETGLSAEERQQLLARERDALAVVSRIIVTSSRTARDLADYGVVTQRISVVSPGTDPAPLAAGSGSDQPSLLCVATLTPRKGHRVLIDALSTLRDRVWHLYCVGSQHRDPTTAMTIRERITTLGLQDRITLVGEVDAQVLQNYYHQADVFVLPSYHEGYGMALSEALARGLPVISTTVGAIPETVPTAAGLLVPPGDNKALATALRRLLDEVVLRQHLASAARMARNQLPNWSTACARFAAELSR